MKRITPHQRRPPLSLPAICQATPGGTPRVFDGRGDALQDHALPKASGRATPAQSLPAICQATPGGTPRVLDGRGDAPQDHALRKASGRATPAQSLPAIRQATPGGTPRVFNGRGDAPQDHALRKASGRATPAQSLPAIRQATPGGTPRVFDGRGDAPQDHALRRASGRATRRRHQHATGFTLLEVVLALTIFFGSIAVLSQINWNGTRAAVQSRLKAQATLLCESKLQEVLVGAEPLSDQSNVAFEDDSNWTWSLTSTATSLPDLIMVEVTVSRDVPGGLGSVSQSLRRWMRDPSLFNSGGL